MSEKLPSGESYKLSTANNKVELTVNRDSKTAATMVDALAVMTEYLQQYLDDPVAAITPSERTSFRIRSIIYQDLLAKLRGREPYELTTTVAAFRESLGSIAQSTTEYQRKPRLWQRALGWVVTHASIHAPTNPADEMKTDAVDLQPKLEGAEVDTLLTALKMAPAILDDERQAMQASGAPGPAYAETKTAPELENIRGELERTWEGDIASLEERANNMRALAEQLF